ISSQSQMNRLPAELLSIIFQNARPQIGFNDDRESFCKTLLAISAVCRQWRNVARGMPSLWTDIGWPHWKPRIGLMFLTLSNPLPLRIFLGIYQCPFASILLRDHSSRIWFLDCSLRASDTNRGETSNLDAAPMQLLFAGQTPRLKKLELRGTPWLVANQFDSLTHLQIQGADANDWDFMPELFVVLSHCPVLQELFLSTFHQEDPPVSALPTVTLGHLRRLAIGDPYEGDLINMFLSHVSLP
ncbi:hypothetical protein B0H21DRAFT_831446, partial [Amylocystis lapponica]